METLWSAGAGSRRSGLNHIQRPVVFAHPYEPVFKSSLRLTFSDLDRPDSGRSNSVIHGFSLRRYGNCLRCRRRAMSLVPAVCGHDGVGTSSEGSFLQHCPS